MGTNFIQWKSSPAVGMRLLFAGLMKAKKERDGAPLAQRFAGCFQRPEDEFWSQYAPFFLKHYKLPSPREALGFAFEARPRIALDLNGGRLPLGCHAWSRMDRHFWLEQVGDVGERSEAGRIE